MDYKNRHKRIFYFLILVFLSAGCSNGSDKEANTFYIELINFNDSLKNYISAHSFGKAVFYKEDQLQVLSTNYITEEYPAIHYLSSIETAGNKPREGAKKIRVEFVGDYSVDSIKYSLQKFFYKNNRWEKRSDMGVIKATTTYKMAKQFSINEFGKQIIRSLAEYTFN